jgi:hypothetical protein
MGRDSSVGIATGYGLDDPGIEFAMFFFAENYVYCVKNG